MASLDPHSSWHGARFELAGTTVGVRDLKQVTEHDLRLIQLLVVAAVLLVMAVVLRRPALALFLVATVAFSYLVTIGLTEQVCHWLYGDAYQGLDWKTPIFLFVILVAVGVDYNIYLVARVLEEQRRRGRLAGLSWPSRPARCGPWWNWALP
jgi:RND superfamily putative drug exporter